ncbi:outer membrane protein assembly factor BamB family protein [Fulvivirga marina]|nr:PQQ-binding-like beta-propeller repeat protein [Fulvivirga marina]
MKIIFSVFLSLCALHINAQNAEIKPINYFAKLIWQNDLDFKEVLPAVKGNYAHLYGSILDVTTGAKLSSEGNVGVFSDQYIVYSTDLKLHALSLEVNGDSIENTRKRAYYIGENKIHSVKDSIWVDIVDDYLIEGINLKTNAKLWQTKSDSRIFNCPIINGDRVLVVNESTLMILNKRNGNPVSRYSIGGKVLSGMKISDDCVYMVVKDIGLVAFDLMKNEVIWTYPLGRYASKKNRIAYDDRYVYVTDNSLFALDKESGVLKWTIDETDNGYIEKTELTVIKDFLLFYLYEEGDQFLTVADKKSGSIIYQGLNSALIGKDSEVNDYETNENRMMMHFSSEVVNGDIIIGVLDDKIYGFKLMK